MKMFLNGAIVQQLDTPNDIFFGQHSRIAYKGIHAYAQNPLLDYADYECRILSEAAMSRKEGDLYCHLEFISDKDLLYRYVRACKEREILIRVLFVESAYPFERWGSGEYPSMQFIGYEYCEIPFDNQIVTDFSWYAPFEKFYPLLNHNGLFAEARDVLAFQKAYDEAWKKDEIGDGEMDTYVCRVYEADLDNVITKVPVSSGS